VTTATQKRREEIYLQGNRDELSNDDPFEPMWPIDQLILYLSGPDEQSWQKVVHALETTQRVGVVRLK